jgi:hypothetical protein
MAETTVSDLHEEANALIDQALVERRVGNTMKWRMLMRLAFSRERAATLLAMSRNTSAQTQITLLGSLVCIARDARREADALSVARRMANNPALARERAEIGRIIAELRDSVASTKGGG